MNQHAHHDTATEGGLQRRLRGYSTLAAATATITVAQTAQAVLITHPINLTSELQPIDDGDITGSFGAVWVDVDQGVAGQSYFDGVDFKVKAGRLDDDDTGVYRFAGAFADMGVAVKTDGPLALNLPEDVLVGADVTSFKTGAAMFKNSTGGASYGYWQPGERGFLGFQFDIPGGSPHFGFADVTHNMDDTVTVHSVGFGSETDEPARTTRISEPHPLGLLAAGAAGIAVFRRRRAAQVAGGGDADVR